jgi:MFS family permease
MLDHKLLMMGNETSPAQTLWSALRQGGWSPLLGGFMVHLTLGTMYCWASNTSYITSAMREGDHSITYSITFPTYVTGMVFQGVCLPLGGLLERRIGSKYTVMFGGSILVCGTLLTWLAIDARSLLLLFATSGALFGAGCGFCYTAPIVCGYRWLPEHKVWCV